MKRRTPPGLVAAVMAAAFALALVPASAARASTPSATTVADPSTATTWRDWGLESSTKNIGRIWTDMTVSDGDITLSGAGGDKTITKGDSDFLTAFSAISSTSNLRETATTPLDIVLVLDASGSMANPMGNGDSTERIDALKAAANSFIDEIAARNAGIANADQRHRVSIVKFAGEKSEQVGNDSYYSGGYRYNYSQVMQNLTVADATGATALKREVDGITPAGATRSDYGIDLARSQLESQGREEAKKVVVFFTDGTPTKQSDFDPEVASAAIASAKTLKAADTTVYSIGIFDGADPSAAVDSNRTSNENKFMQAVSGNYPSATYSSDWWNNYSWSFGTRVENAAFYKTATNADKLKTIFNDISKEISDAAGYPTDVTEGAENESGYVTFTAQLGDYMKVDDFNHIVFANQVFDAHTKTTSGNVDTYTFQGEAGNALYPSGNLSDIVIVVRRASEDNLRTGDHVTVEIPAALIPLRAFDVDADEGTGSVTLTFPIRVFFGSSLKDGVKELLANPDEQMVDYIACHTDEKGNVFFLANAWSGGSDGNATAAFTPAEENSYYYITRDTPIYEDKALAQPASYPLMAGKTYYYQRQYWDIAGSSAAQESTIVSFDSSAIENINGYVTRTYDGHAQFSAGTRRMTYINEMHDDKDANSTETATSFINPKWSSSQVAVRLGNNGRLSLVRPGSLEVEKRVQVPDGYDAADFEDDEFEFTLSVPEAAGRTLKATVTKDGIVQGDEGFDVAFDSRGGYSHKLKDAEKITITGLEAGWTYKVSEVARTGWTTAAEGEEGTIAAGVTSSVEFTNTYAAAGTLVGRTSLAGKKEVKGRDWVAEDRFVFVLTGIDDAPMPADSKDGKFALTLVQPEGTPEGQDVDFHFGDITYTKPGTYVYNIVEARAGDGYDVNILPGMSVSQALYRAVVTVTDAHHDGTLKVESAIWMIKDNAGVTITDHEGNEDPQKMDWALFSNEFNVTEAEWNLRGTKRYTDNSGSNPLTRGMFKFELVAKTEGAPMPNNTADDKATAEVDATGRFAFEQVSFDENDVDKTYEYELREVNDGKPGYTYDDTVWNIAVKVTAVPSEVEGEPATVVLEVTNTRGGQETVPGETIIFENSYNATPVTAGNFIRGTKTLRGRDSLDGEKFAFSLTQISGPASGCTGFSPTAEVSGLKDGAAQDFNFGTATFTRTGTYVFEVREVAPAQPAGGMTYDGHTCTVTVKVADRGGELYVQSTTYSDEGDVASFNNSYAAADTAYAGITVSKTLIGRTMREGEFDFTIIGEDESSEALLADPDRSFSNDGQRASGEKNVMAKLNGIVFSRTDVGEYRFKVAEVVPDGDAKLAGVTYDGTVHEVVITVADALDGTLGVTTTVDGMTGNEVAFQNTYQAAPGGLATASFGLSKVLEGRDWASSDDFTFELVALNGAPMPASSQVTVTAANARDGRAPFDFGEIAYDAAGTYEYEVREVNAGQIVNGIDYSTNVARFRVTVTDSGTGRLVASSRLLAGSAAFVNRYSAELDYNAKGGLTITKALEGTSAAAGRFGFTVTAEDDDVLGIAGTYSSPEIADGGTTTIAATSGDVIFTQNDAGKTWNYTVAEDDPGSGYSCECSTWNVSVGVENDVPAGRLVVITTVWSEVGGTRAWTYASDGEAVADGAKVAFVNRYAATGSTADIVGTKELTGRLMNDAEFSFELVDAATGSVVATATNRGGEVNFGTLSYTAPGTYAYEAREVTDGLSGSGVTATEGAFTLTVDVTDNGDGTLTCNVAYPDGGLAFKNSYGADDAELEFAGTKVLDVPAGLTGPESIAGCFAFTITGEDGAPMPERTMVTNDASDGHAFSFGKIRFTLENVFGEKTEEPAMDANGGRSPVHEEDAEDEEAVTGAVAEPSTSSDPTAAADPTFDGEKSSSADELVPTEEPRQDGLQQEGPLVADEGNACDTPATADEPADMGGPDGSEDVLPDLDMPVVDESAKAADPVAPDATDVAALNAARWSTFRRNLFHIASEAIKAQVVSASRQRILHYVVSESGHVAGVTNDARSSRDVYVKVTDDGLGHLTAEFVDAGGKPTSSGLTFTNSYETGSMSSSVTDQARITKVLEGRDLVAGEFRFQMLEDGQVVATGTNDADGNVTLSAITYDVPGSHAYVIREIDAGRTVDGVKFDDAAYHVNTTVEDAGDGTLSVRHELTESEAVFTNRYEAAPADVTVSAKKSLVGAELAAGRFAFKLLGEGTELAATNDGNGDVLFSHLLFDEPGTYVYELCELDDGQDGVSYDETAYVVTITVADDGLGHLSAEVTNNATDGMLTFTNVYVSPSPEPAPVPPSVSEQPSVPQPKEPSPQKPAPAVEALPKTGDMTSGAVAAVLAAVVTALLAAAFLTRRK